MHSIVECPGLRHIMHCIVGRNRRSSSVGSARWRAPIINHELFLCMSMTRSMTWPIMLVRKSITAHTVRRGSWSAARNIAFASTSGGARVSWLCILLEPNHELLDGFCRILPCSVDLSNNLSLIHLFVEKTLSSCYALRMWKEAGLQGS